MINTKDRSDINTELEEEKNFCQKKQTYINPFPGLRPFRLEETHVFFGREDQVDEVLEKLEQNRLIAILGSSGSGKSSLMYCGVIPALYGGFMSKAGSNWRLIVARPGIAPIKNIAQEISKQDLQASTDEEEQKILTKYKLAELRSSSLGLVEILKKMRQEEDENILLLVDQFEEIFRFSNSSTNTDSSNESGAFVKMLLRAVKQSEIPVYVIMTMRSDYIGDCAQFPQLTSLINESHYLIPQMTRSQKQKAILGPSLVSNAEITPRLVQKLLNDLGNSTDQLPIMQHALMRTWNYWNKYAREKGEPIDMLHYEAIGGMDEALSLHADEAYDELNEKQKVICAFVFKSITEKGIDGRGIRRPTRLADLAAIANTTVEELVKVIESFRQHGRTFLMPPSDHKLSKSSIIDISHESLMRVWTRCRTWVEEESDSSKIYLRLCEASAAYHKGDSGLWRPPELQVAINWQQKQKTNPTWGQRYHPAFERSMSFLETSKRAYEQEQSSKERLQKKALQKSRVFNIAMGVAAIVAILLVIYANIKAGESKAQQKIAQKNAKTAEYQSNIAKANAEKAKANEDLAIKRQQEALLALRKAQQEKEKRKAEAKRAEKGELQARKNAALAQQERQNADRQAKLAQENAKKAQYEANKAEKLRYLSIAQTMAVKSLQIKDTAQRVLVAKQAFLFNQSYQGSAYNSDIYSALYYANKLLEGEKFNLLQGHSDAVRVTVFSQQGQYLYSSGSDGKIIRWDFKNTKKTPVVMQEVNSIIRSMHISPNDKWLATGNNQGQITIYNLSEPNNTPITRSYHQGAVCSIIFSQDNKTIYTAAEDSIIAKWDLRKNLKVSLLVKAPLRLKGIALSPNQKTIVGALENGNIMLWETIVGSSGRVLFSNYNDVATTVAFNTDGTKIFAGFQSGKVAVWNINKNQLEIDLEGHTATIAQIAFSNDGKFAASASFDHTVRVWHTKKLTDQPIVINDHTGWVQSIAFCPDNKNIISSTVNKTIRYFTLDLEQVADKICKNLHLIKGPKKLSKKNWGKYVGQDIPFEETCITN